MLNACALVYAIFFATAVYIFARQRVRISFFAVQFP